MRPISSTDKKPDLGIALSGMFSHVICLLSLVFQLDSVHLISGQGVFVTRSFYKGEFLVRYTGDLISEEEEERRENAYTEQSGSFLYFFKDGRKKWW